MDHAKECRTVVVLGVPDFHPSTRMADKLTIHFQRSRNDGGDVEKTEYPTNIKGVAFVTFERIQDAERVVKKDHIMEDHEFSCAHPITVFKFTPDVFCFVRAEVDLSIFGDQEVLIEVLKANHRSVRICPLRSNGIVIVEGSFQAVKNLREELKKILQGAKGHSASSESTVQPQKDITWVDTTVFVYIHRFHLKQLIGCHNKYSVKVTFEEQGDLTLITVTGKDSSTVRSAKSKMEQLVAMWQSDLRTQRIEYGSRRRETFLELCNDIDRNFSDVMLVPRESCVEVVGPSASSHDFCKRVEHSMSAVNRQPLWSSDGASLTGAGGRGVGDLRLESHEKTGF